MRGPSLHWKDLRRSLQAFYCSGAAQECARARLCAVRAHAASKELTERAAKGRLDLKGASEFTNKQYKLATDRHAAQGL
jgi:hypothetical protein